MEMLFHEASLLLFNLFLVPVALFSAVFYLLAVLGVRSRRAPRPRASPKRWPSVTVQIPTKDETVALRCAKACLAFDYPGKVQVIIGDDSTDPAISHTIASFSRTHSRVTVTRRGSTAGYKPGNLNHMLRFTQGEVVVVFDSDFVPPRHFLRKIVEPLACDPSVAAVQAKWDYLNRRQNRISKFASSILMIYHHLLAPVNERLGVSLLFGSAEAVRASVLRKLGGWKDWSMTEDVEFTLRALKEGYKTVYLKELAVPGEVPFTLRGLAKQQKRWAYGNAKAFLANSRWILFGKQLSFLQKAALTLTLLGYISAPFLVVFVLLGFMTWFTGTPGTVDVAKFSFTTGQMLLVNSGFLAAALVALRKEKSARLFLSVLGTSLTVGIWISISVFDGLMKALSRKPMQWYMIPKMGNQAPFS